MNLSSKTLFHFTNQKNNLLGILENGIFVRYSLETYGEILKSKNELVLPMACFCDIPLSKIKEHTKKYGTYSIGLSKEWGMKNGLSPVIYTHSKSNTAKILNSLTKNITEIFDIDKSEENDRLLKEYGLSEYELNLIKSGNDILNSKLLEKNEELSEQLGHFLKYIKPYEGIGYSNGKKFEDIRFYDEREWRYVPPKDLLKKVEVKDIYKREFYIDPIKKKYINRKLSIHKKLTFEPKDIKFLIIKKENEIPSTIEEIGEIFKNKIAYP